MGVSFLWLRVVERLLNVNQSEAETCEYLRRYLELGSVRLLMSSESPKIPVQSGVAKNETIGGNPFFRGGLFMRCLSNPFTLARFVTKWVHILAAESKFVAE